MSTAVGATGLDARDARALEATLSELRSVYGSRLRAVVLCGEAATEAYSPRRSPLSLAAVLDRVAPEALRMAAPYVKTWRRRRVGVPLLFDPAYIATARDVFPLEFLDLSDRHLVLFGDDPFAELPCDLGSLRAEVEAQLRGKLLHLREAYLEAGGSTAAVRDLLLQSSPAFEVVMRGMLRLRDARRPAAPSDLLPEVERVLGLELPAMRELAEARAGRRKVARAEVQPLFERYYGDVLTLVGKVDAP